MINNIMRISELTGYKNHPEYKKLIQKPSWERFLHRAEENGWKLYGRGGGGGVLKHPNKDFLYKVFGGRARFEESGYLGYTNFVLKNRNNPYVPKISKPVKIPKTADGPTTGPAAWKTRDVYVLKIEILEEPKGKNDPRFKKYIHKDYVDNISHLDHTTDLSLHIGEKRDTLYDHAMESLYDFDKDWRAIVEYAGDGIDIGINNVMFRGDQLVFIDPMVG